MNTSPVSSLRILVPTGIRFEPGGVHGTVESFGGHCMGTTWSVRAVCPQPDGAGALQADIALILETIEQQMSHFRDDSDLCRYARLPAGEWMQMPAEFAHVMRAALDVARASNGAFDPSVGAAIEAWGFGARRRFVDAGFQPPAEGVACGARWQQIKIDAEDMIMQPGGVMLNLAAIAKGFAVDAVSGYLTRLGLVHHLVEVGGELRGAGMKPDLQPWWVALEMPAADCPLSATRIALHGLAVATSGDYRRRYRLGDRLFQHTLDPRTGMPVSHALASVSIIHEECMMADAWATAIMVLGPVDALKLAERMGLCALLQWPDESGGWTEVCSSAWKRLEQ